MCVCVCVCVCVRVCVCLCVCKTPYEVFNLANHIIQNMGLFDRMSEASYSISYFYFDIFYKIRTKYCYK